MTVATHVFAVRVPPDHPSLAGHFPDRPMVPGALLLDEICRALKAWRPDLRVVGIESFKFSTPLAPAQEALVALEAVAPTRVQCRCTAGATTVASGYLRVGPAP